VVVSVFFEKSNLTALQGSFGSTFGSGFFADSKLPNPVSVVAPNPLLTGVEVKPNPLLLTGVEVKPNPLFAGVVEPNPVFVAPNPLLTGVEVKPNPLFAGVVDPNPVFVAPNPLLDGVDVKPNPLFADVVDPNPVFVAPNPLFDGVDDVKFPKPVFELVFEWLLPVKSENKSEVLGLGFGAGVSSKSRRFLTGADCFGGVVVVAVVVFFVSPKLGALGLVSVVDDEDEEEDGLSSLGLLNLSELILNPSLSSDLISLFAMEPPFSNFFAVALAFSLSD